MYTLTGKERRMTYERLFRFFVHDAGPWEKWGKVSKFIILRLSIIWINCAIKKEYVYRNRKASKSNYDGQCGGFPQFL